MNTFPPRPLTNHPGLLRTLLQGAYCIIHDNDKRQRKKTQQHTEKLHHALTRQTLVC